MKKLKKQISKKSFNESVDSAIVPKVKEQYIRNS
jgi:hypothetical protein